jgi:hypothetical protein
MASAWGSALLSLGESLPRIGAAFDQASEERRKRMQEEEDRKRRQEMSDMQLEELRYEQGMRKQAGEAYDQYSGAMRSMGQINIPSDVPTTSGGASSQLPESSMMKTPLDFMRNYDVPRYAAFDKGVKSAVDTEMDIEKMDRGIGKGGGGAVWSQKKALFDADPKAMEKLSTQIDELQKIGVLTEISANYFKRRMTTDPISTSTELDNFVSKPEIAGKIISAQTGPKVQQAYDLIPPAVTKSGLETEADLRKKKEEQIRQPVYSEPQSNSMSDAYSAVQYLNKLKNALSKGDVGYFDINRKTGQFTDPEVADAFIQMVEIVGRKRSGAAISDSEWGNFGKQILNKNNLLTDAGKKQALSSINSYLDKFYGAGANISGNENWYKDYDKRAKTARSNAETPPAVNAPIESSGPVQIKTDADYDKLPSGSEFIGPDGKRRRKP